MKIPSLCLCLCLLAAACPTSDKETGSSPGGAIARGKALFDEHCSPCHASASSVAGGPPSHLREVIREGTGGMPAQSQLSEQQIDDLVAYLRSL